VDSDGTGLKLLVTHRHDGPWSPDGRLVAYLRSSDSLVVVSADGGKPKLLANHVEGFDWSPAGARIAYSVGAGDLVVVNTDGTARTTIDQDTHDPQWSPAGESIAFDRKGVVYLVARRSEIAYAGGSDKPRAGSPCIPPRAERSCQVICYGGGVTSCTPRRCRGRDRRARAR
jgi:hypothetical protein